MQLDYTKATSLCEIMGRYGSDKGSTNIRTSWHNYTVFYHSIFQPLADKPLRIFELGLGTNNVNMKSNMGANGKPGASLYGWAEFFPNATIFGADIDRDILFNTPRIKTYYCDQMNPSIVQEMWNHPDLQAPFDIIVEDGLHSYEANVCFFENSIHRLKEGGIYIIEDIVRDTIDRWTSKLAEWSARYPTRSFELVRVPSEGNDFDNNLIYIY
jgi:SAM-dependent methyltransferase